MAGIFGFFDYTKEGPGIDPDAPPKGAIATFFGILGRKFWKLISINLLYVITNIPAILVAFFLSNIVLNAIFPGLTIDLLNEMWDPGVLEDGQTAEQLSASVLLMLNLVLTAASVGLGFIVTGPSHAGATYIMRNYAREEHAFVWSDFFEHARKNFKQSAIVSIITTLLFVAVPVAIRFYSQTIQNVIFRTLLNTTLVILFVMMTVMIMYIYQMLITFDLKIKQIVKNAWLFFVLRLPFNILIILASLLIVFVIPLALLLFLGGIGIIISVLYYLFFAFAINLLLVNFFINRQLMRFMIKPMLEEEDETEEDYEADADYEYEDEEALAEDDEEASESLEDDGLPEGKRSPAY